MSAAKRYAVYTSAHYPKGVTREPLPIAVRRDATAALHEARRLVNVNGGVAVVMGPDGWRAGVYPSDMGAWHTSVALP